MLAAGERISEYMRSTGFLCVKCQQPQYSQAYTHNCAPRSRKLCSAAIRACPLFLYMIFWVDSQRFGVKKYMVFMVANRLTELLHTTYNSAESRSIHKLKPPNTFTKVQNKFNFLYFSSIFLLFFYYFLLFFVIF